MYELKRVAGEEIGLVEGGEIQLQPLSQAELQMVDGGMMNLGRLPPPPRDPYPHPLPLSYPTACELNPDDCLIDPFA